MQECPVGAPDERTGPSQSRAFRVHQFADGVSIERPALRTRVQPLEGELRKSKLTTCHHEKGGGPESGPPPSLSCSPFSSRELFPRMSPSRGPCSCAPPSARWSLSCW